MNDNVSEKFGEFLESRTAEQKERLMALNDKAQAALDEFMSFRQSLEKEWEAEGGKPVPQWTRMDHFVVTLFESEDEIGHRISALSGAKIVQVTANAFVEGALSDGEKMRLLAECQLAPLMVLEMGNLADSLVHHAMKTATTVQSLAQMRGEIAEKLPVGGNA